MVKEDLWNLTCLLHKAAEWMGRGMVGTKQIGTRHQQHLLYLIPIRLDSKMPIYLSSEPKKKKKKEGREGNSPYTKENAACTRRLEQHNGKEHFLGHLDGSVS